ncbi:MAG: methylglyoxal synthase [Elusimicrobiota bacterium]|nr:methylglyoxal synthase [Elusimicrobiota bacterium]
MNKIKNIGLVAHDACKNSMMEWVAFNAKRLSAHNLICTGTTGRLVEETLKTKFPNIKANITKLKSGPLGGDQQMGALIATDKLDILIFFTDPMTTQPHDVDIKALIRLSTIANIVVACTRSSADFMISSPLFDAEYPIIKDNHEDYIARLVK